jgi:UDP-glucuronate decarboxylase
LNIVLKILVTGGAGFLGSNLCRQLLLSGHSVVCLDNFQTGLRANVEALLQHKAFSLLEQDVCDPIDVAVDQIYNLACPASPPHYQADPIKTFKTSVLGAINILELAKRLNVPVLQASTSEIYGDPHQHPQRESYWGNVNPIGPRACYDEGKRGAETLFFDYHRQYGVKIKVVRIFNTYGPLMDAKDGRVVSNLIVQALSGAPMTLYGDGEQTRSFCFVDDLLRGLIAMMESDHSVTGPINIGNPKEFTMKELALMVRQLTGSNTPLVYRPLPVDDPKQRRPDIRLAAELIGWVPQVDLADGLRQTIGYFRQVLERDAKEMRAVAS